MSAKQNIDSPHERRPFKAHGHMDVVTLGDFTLGRGVFEPGWRWSDDVKPIAGTDSCQTHHVGLCLSGQMNIRFEDGSEIPYDYVLVACGARLLWAIPGATTFWGVPDAALKLNVSAASACPAAKTVKSNAMKNRRLLIRPFPLVWKVTIFTLGHF